MNKDNPRSAHEVLEGIHGLADALGLRGVQIHVRKDSRFSEEPVYTVMLTALEYPGKEASHASFDVALANLYLAMRREATVRLMGIRHVIRGPAVIDEPGDPLVGKRATRSVDESRSLVDWGVVVGLDLNYPGRLIVRFDPGADKTVHYDVSATRAIVNAWVEAAVEHVGQDPRRSNDLPVRR